MIQFLKKTIVAAGKICMSEQASKPTGAVKYKGPRDLVTPTDVKVEHFFREALTKTFPQHDIIGEEEGSQITGSRYCWIIDPIDGTTSYYHGQPYYSISIAFKEDDVLTGAAIYAPALGQLFHAVRGKGAFLNEIPIAVSDCRQLDSALLATGFACLRSNLAFNNLDIFNCLMPKIRDIRRCGSAALDLAYVAAGKYDGFWEVNLNLYDIAAGVLLVQEAGGVVSDFTGGENYPKQGIAAANALLLKEMLPYLKL